MKYLLTLLLIGIALSFTHARIVSTISSGSWNSNSTWSINSLPIPTDTILIQSNHELKITLDSAIVNTIMIDGAIRWSQIKSVFCNSLILNNNSIIEGNVLGNIIVLDSTVINGNCTIGKLHFSSQNTSIHGNLNLSNSSGNKSLGELSISNTGKISSTANEDIYVNHKISNKGIWELKDSKIYFAGSNFLLSGNYLEIKDLVVNDSMTISNYDSLYVSNSILDISGKSKLINQTGSYFKVGTTDGNNSLSQYDFSSFQNTVEYDRNGVQKLEMNGIYDLLILSNNTSISIESDITVNSITIRDSSKLSTNGYHFIPIGSNSSFKILNSASLASGSFSSDWYNFLDDFDFVSIDSLASVEITSENDVNLKSINVFENLMIECTNTSDITFDADTIIVKGDLELNASASLNIDNKTLHLKGDFSGLGTISSSNSTIVYNGSDNQTTYKKDHFNLIVDNDSDSIVSGSGTFDVLNVLTISNGVFKIGSTNVSGETTIDSSGHLLFGAVTVSFEDSLKIDGEFTTSAASGTLEIDHLKINNHGSWNIQHNINPTILNSITNNGTFSGCPDDNCTYDFGSQSISLSGLNEMKFPKAKHDNISSITNFGIVCFSIDIESFGDLINHNTVNFGANSTRMEVQNLTNKAGSSISYSGTDQNILIPTDSIYYGLSISGSGEKTLKNTLVVIDSLTVQKDSKLIVEINFTASDSCYISLADSSDLWLGSNDEVKDIQLPNNLTRSHFDFSASSTVKYQSKSNQSISTTPKYGNLSIDDGNGSNNIKSLISNDSLIVKGNLDLEESSFTFLIDRPTIIYKNWTGVGNTEINNTQVQIKGDATNSGTLSGTNFTVIYNGNRNQEIKIGDYETLEIDGLNTYAEVNGSTGTLTANTVNILSGTLDIGNETVTIEDEINIDGTLHFSSTGQTKTFGNVNLQNAGTITFDKDELISIHGDLRNNGSFALSLGTIEFTNDTIDQAITGNGTSEFNNISVNKNTKSLDIQSPISVNSSFDFNSGTSKLSSTITLNQNASITNENNNNYFLGENGSIETTRSFIPGVQNSFGNIGISIVSNSNLGETTIIRTHPLTTLNLDSAATRQFDISAEFDSGLNATLQFDFLNHEFKGDKMNQNIYKQSNGQPNWSLQGGAVDTINNFVQLSNVSSFSKWTIAPYSEIALSVDLIDFRATNTNDEVLLTWIVGSEFNIEKYTIEYSFNNESSHQIADISANNNRFDQSEYQVKHKAFRNGIHYYSLYETSESGERILLKTISIQINNKEFIYYNSSNNTIISTVSDKTMSYMITDLFGKIIQHGLIETEVTTLSDLKPGLYILSIINEDEIEVSSKIRVN